jgi:hypothetical protein
MGSQLQRRFWKLSITVNVRNETLQMKPFALKKRKFLAKSEKKIGNLTRITNSVSAA